MSADSPRDVLLDIARAYAEMARRNLDTPLAARWDALAAELRGPSDLATSTRLLADDYAEAGYAQFPHTLRRMADTIESGGDEYDELARRVEEAHDRILRRRQEAAAAIGSVPVDGREVDRAPMAGPKHAWLTPTWARDCRCYIGRDHTEYPQNYESRVSIKTGDEAGGSPPAEPANPPSGPASSPHYWIRDDHVPCFCLIGDDHVAEPRFEKES
jgi:hypothetical protein